MRPESRRGLPKAVVAMARGFGLCAARYAGLGKTLLQVLATAAAINLHHLFDFWSEVSRAVRGVSVFARLAPDPALLRRTWRSA
jgi:hypothetical protein